MAEVTSYPLAKRTVVKHGVELPWEERERYGSELKYKHGPREGESMYPDRQPTGTVINRGTVFVELEVLEELLNAEHSLGMGGAYLVGYREGMALEQAGLAMQETRGGYFTREDERAKLEAIIDGLYEEIQKANKK